MNFYMVYVNGGTAPTKHYTSLEEAKVEAERLMNKEGRIVHILLSIAWCAPPAAVWHDASDPKDVAPS